MERVLVITVAEHAPEMFFIGDAVAFMHEETARRAAVVWARGVSGHSPQPPAGITVESHEVFDFRSNDASQRLVAFARAFASDHPLTAIASFGLGIGSRLGIVLGRVLHVPATIVFNAFQLRFARERTGYVAHWCARAADRLVATDRIAYDEALPWLPRETSLTLSETTSSRAMLNDVDLLALVDGRYAADRAFVKEIRDRHPNAAIVDCASVSDSEPVVAKTVIARGTRTDYEVWKHFIRGTQWVHSDRWTPVDDVPESAAEMARSGPPVAHLHTARWKPIERTTGRRILFITYGYAPDLGGVPESSHRVVAQLRALGYDVTVFAPQSESTDDDPQVIRIAGSLWQSEHELDAVALRAAREHARSPFDVVIGFFVVPAGLFAVAIAKQLGLPSIISARGNDISKYGFISAARVDWALRHADAVTAVSENLAELMDAFTGRGGCATIIPNSVDVPPAATCVRRAMRPIPVVGMVGIFRWKKGWQLFLRALALLGDRVQGRLIGEVVDDEKPELERLRRDLARDVEYTGMIAPSEIDEQITDLDLFVSPSLDEGMPNALLKAIARGIPVVASDLPGHRILIRDDDHGLLVRPGDATGLAEAIQKGLEEPARTRRAMRALTTIGAEFLPPVEASAYARLIDRVTRSSYATHIAVESAPTTTFS